MSNRFASRRIFLTQGSERISASITQIMDGEEKIFPFIDIAKKHFKMKAIMKIGAVTPHAKSHNRLVISLNVEELELS